MRVTRKNIEKLGFNLIVNGFNEDYTFNRLSNTRENWYDVIVWQPRTNEIGLSTHCDDLATIWNHGIPKGKKMSDYIIQLTTLESVETMGDVVKMLKRVKFI